MTTTVRPAGSPAGAAAWTVTSASAVAVALADNSDSTYIRKTNDPAASVVVSFGSFALAGTERVRGVRLRCRAATPQADSRLAAALGVLSTTPTGTAAVYGPAVRLDGVHATGELAGPYYALAPDGQAWDQARLDGLRVQLTDYRAGSSRAFVYELYVDADLAGQPSASITSPAASVTDTTLPEIAWTWDDPDDDGQAYYEVKVFTAAQVADPTFDPLTFSPLWTTGQLSGADQSVAVGEYLPSGGYGAYVRVAKPVNGSPFWSEWSDRQFVVDVATVDIPDLAALFVPAANRVELTVTGAALGGLDGQGFVVQRSTDAGATWATVRGADDLTPDPAGVAYVDDYEAPRGVTVLYRVRSIAWGGTPWALRATAWSTPLAVAVTNDGLWWVKLLSRPELNHGGARILAGLDESVEEDVGVFRPKGRTKAVVVSGTVGGEDGTYRVISSGDAEWSSVRAWAYFPGTLLVQDPGGLQKYVRVIQRAKTTTGATSALRRELTLGYVEVDG